MIGLEMSPREQSHCPKNSHYTFIDINQKISILINKSEVLGISKVVTSGFPHKRAVDVKVDSTGLKASVPQSHNYGPNKTATFAILYFISVIVRDRVSLYIPD